MNLGKAINRLIAIDPQLSEKLVPIRESYLMQPRRSKTFWKKLIEVLNSEPLLSHPRRKELRMAIVDPPRSRRLAYTFKEVDKNDHIIGIIPEHLADKLRRYDRRTIELAKKSVEADMTDDQQAKAQIERRNEIREIELQKLWIPLKDHFNIWGKSLAVTIKKQGPHLVLTMKQHCGRCATVQTPFGTAQLNPEQLKKFFEQTGLPPPPGLFPEEDDD